jgi:hypothetical protein
MGDRWFLVGCAWVYFWIWAAGPENSAPLAGLLTSLLGIAVFWLIDLWIARHKRNASRACAIGAAPVAQAVNSQSGDEE